MNKDTNIRIFTNDTNGNEYADGTFVLIRIIRKNSYIGIFILFSSGKMTRRT